MPKVFVICVAVHFNCYTFCGYAANLFGTFAIPLRYIAKEPSSAQAQRKKTVIPTTTTIPLEQYKNGRKHT